MLDIPYQGGHLYSQNCCLPLKLGFILTEEFKQRSNMIEVSFEASIFYICEYTVLYIIIFRYLSYSKDKIIFLGISSKEYRFVNVLFKRQRNEKLVYYECDSRPYNTLMERHIIGSYFFFHTHKEL